MTQITVGVEVFNFASNNTNNMKKMKKINKMTIAFALFVMISLSSCLTTSTGLQSSMVNPYPSDYCIVTGNELGSMGDPISIGYKGREIKFCCKPCVKKFYKDPSKYLSNLEDYL